MTEGLRPAGDPAPAGEVAGIPRGPARRLLPDILSVVLVYLFSGLGILIYAGYFLDRGSASIRLLSPSILLLAVLPLTSLGVLIFQLRRLLIDYLRKRYAARLRLKLAAFFMALALVAGVSQAFLALRLAALAPLRVHAAEMEAGLGLGISLLGDFRDAAQRRLAVASASVLPSSYQKQKDASALLSALQAVDPAIEALEFVGADSDHGFAGVEGARLRRGGSIAAGDLSAETSGGVTRLRYALQLDTQLAVATLRLPDSYEAGAHAIAVAELNARNDAELIAGWPVRMLVAFGLFGFPLLLLALLVGIAAADLVVEPLASLEDATRRISSGQTSARILAKAGDERGLLIASFNHMLDELESLREGGRIQERVDAWKDLAQRLAHELKNPLTPIRLAAERLRRVASHDREKALSIIDSATAAIISEVDAMTGLLDDFRTFARLPTPAKDRVPLDQLLGEAVAVYRASYPETRFDIADPLPDIELSIDRGMIKRALGNLLANSIEAMGGQGRISLSADLVTAGQSSYCRIRLSDTGKGIPEDIRDRIFTPYFTTKESGTGLGLAIVERILHDHGGRVRFESAPGFGSVFWIDLPTEAREGNRNNADNSGH